MKYFPYILFLLLYNGPAKLNVSIRSFYSIIGNDLLRCGFV